MKTVFLFLQIVIISAVLLAGLYYANKRLGAYFASRPHLKFRHQLIQIVGALLAVLFVILFMPFGDVLRGQLLRLYGLIFSATIALSSTTLVDRDSDRRTRPDDAAQSLPCHQPRPCDAYLGHAALGRGLVGL